MSLNYLFCIVNRSMCNCDRVCLFFHVLCAAFVVKFAAELRRVADPILHDVHGCSSCHLACRRRFKHKPNQNVLAFQIMLCCSTETCSCFKNPAQPTVALGYISV